MHAIGIDMSKDTFHAAFDEQTVRVYQNSGPGVKRFLKALQDRSYTASDTMIGTESTGVYHLLFCRTVTESGYQVRVLNPFLTHRMITSTLRRVKTDHHDALAIRKTLLVGNAGYMFVDTPDVMALKTLVREREGLCRMKAETKQRIHVHGVVLAAAGVRLHDSYGPVMKVFSKEILLLERQMRTYAPETQELLRSIPGIGKISAAALVAHIGDIRRFPSAEKLTAYVGLDCRVHQSGTSVHGKGFITKRGNSYLRGLLFNAAFIARQRNRDLKAFFERKLNEGKHYYNAQCAVERKLTHLIYAVWSRGTPFEKRH
jgi:transposase